MYRTIQQTLLGRIEAILLARYALTLPGPIAIEQPPTVALGELALPIAFELAKRLRKAPRAIAIELQQALTDDLANLPGVAGIEVAGAGYLNVRLDRAAMVARIARDEHAALGGPGFRLIEHTSINPNKAAHIGICAMRFLVTRFNACCGPMITSPAGRSGSRTTSTTPACR